MTKEDFETANKLADELTLNGTQPCTRNDVYTAALTMATFKDNQLKKELTRMIERFNGEESHNAYFSAQTLKELFKNLLPDEPLFA